jgi:CheY-like chemotaxis protein
MKKILLVNSQEAFLGRNKNLLNRAGFMILTATSAKDALEIYREQSIDLIISVLDLPEIAGDTLCSTLRSGNDVRRVPFILVCYDVEAELERASQCGANAWLTRPVRPELLLEQVGKYLKIPTRRNYRATFNAKVEGTRERLQFSGMTRNISITGLLCETDMQLVQDDLITNLLLAIDSHQIVADGKVVRTEIAADGTYKYGVQFTNLSPESRDRINEYVSAPPKDPSEQ